MLPFTLNDIHELAADTATFQRGKTYYQSGKVLDIHVENQQAVATVLGGRKYRTQLSLTAQGLEGKCSCFMYYRCKHLVATALAWQAVTDKQPSWQHWLNAFSVPHVDNSSHTHSALTPSIHHLLYQLDPDHSGHHVSLRFLRAYLKQDGSWSQLQEYFPSLPVTSYMLPAFMADTDLHALTSIESNERGYHFSGAAGYSAIMQIMQEQRLYNQKHPVKTAEARKLSWNWQDSPEGKQLCADLEGTDNWRLLQTEPPCFLDLDSNQVGPIVTDIKNKQITHLLQAPVLPAEAWSEAAYRISKSFSEQQLKPPIDTDTTHISEFTPHLHLHLVQYFDNFELPGLTLHFDYGEYSMAADYEEAAQPCTFVLHQGKGLIVQRNLKAETEVLDELAGLGLTLYAVNEDLVWGVNPDKTGGLVKLWKHFINHHIPLLKQRGWTITAEADFKFQPTRTSVTINLGDTEGGWFELSLGLLDVDLADNNLDTTNLVALWLEEDAPDELVLPSSQGLLQIDTRPLQQIHSFLKDLILQHDLNQTIRLPLYHAAQLSNLPDLDQRAAPVTRKLIEQLSKFQGIEPVAPAHTLQAQLRDYQQQGVNWLHFLYRYRLGGILADDMGLGKTLQVLAFIAGLKEQQHLKHQVLVVAPTSLLGNWQREATRFVPGLQTIIFHGTDRHAQIKLVQQADIVLTSYALLHLDAHYHQQQHYALAVLDEAQAIKNPKTKTAISARQLNADLRLCLSGTPLENHLGELWSLMDFSLPGLLYGQDFFNTQLRNPIEKEGNQQARQELAKKIAPFILRRTKQQVAAELPEKTVITQYIQLGNKQAALYESIRLSMEKRIRDLIDKKGLAKSHIEFLDALLKLRQACIAPQLVKLAQANKVQESAKLDWLADNLPAMLEEGRRVLIFSQFTQALGLVEDLLEKRKISYSKLTGATRNRQKAIDAFQQGTNEVFLISLKAGGAGLNLTRADTVIHLDPWWNPAVENQATDRAHRIGQDKPVFVYKLVASSTVEERIQQMQEQKQALADSLFDSTQNAPKPENKDELLSLLAY